MAKEVNENTLKKIKQVQRKWTEGITHIGEAVWQKLGQEEVNKRANGMLDELYDFENSPHILFKPTQAIERPFRFNRKETLSYFIGRNGVDWNEGDKRIKEDDGFALKPWKQVIFLELEDKNIIQQDCDFLVMASYIFIDYRGNEVPVEYTFGYRGEDQRIFLHHSSAPYEEPLPLLPSLKESAKKEQGATGFRVTLPGEASYGRAREISNAYFDYKPKAIAFPRTTNQVAFSMREFNEINHKRSKADKIPLRIMSGGHQHEGMSSGNDAFIIRLSELGNIEFNADKTQAWIPAGMKLGDVYSELELHNKTIPAGGCMNVNVGGLTQGGGWGMNSRKYGLTCDNIDAAEVVLTNGDIVQASNQQHPDLFWAIRGGGGGNFGVATRFLFKLQDLSPELCVFRFYWAHDQMTDAISAFLELQKDFPPEMTSFLRLAAMPKPKKDSRYKDYPVYASGLFHGSFDEMNKILEPLKEKVNPLKSECFVRRSNEFTKEELEAARGVDMFDIDKLIKAKSSAKSTTQLYKLTSIVDLFNYDVFMSSLESLGQQTKQNSCQIAPPTSNCGAPHPHKVSSAFSKVSGQSYYRQVAEVVTEYFEETVNGKYAVNLPYVRSYMTFHAMGGAMSNPPEGGSAFAFRSNEFLIQIQSWWNYSTTVKGCSKKMEWQKPYIDWVTNFRAKLEKANLIEGAFINFVDKNLGPDPSTAEGRYELLKYYYGDNLDRLIEIKSQYDPNNICDFEMGIPVSG